MGQRPGKAAAQHGRSRQDSGGGRTRAEELNYNRWVISAHRREASNSNASFGAAGVGRIWIWSAAFSPGKIAEPTTERGPASPIQAPASLTELDQLLMVHVRQSTSLALTAGKIKANWLTFAEQVKSVVVTAMIEGMQEFVKSVPIIVEANLRRTWAEDDSLQLQLHNSAT